MNKSSQGQAARRFQASSFECELPLGACTELTQPRRPRIPGPPLPVKRMHPRWPFYVILTLGLVALGGAVTTLWRQQERERASSTKAISQPLAPQPIAPSAPPASGPARSWPEYVAQHPNQFPYRAAPRATLVKLPPPRAPLAGDLPPLVVGQHYLATMPYDNNLEVLMTFKGWLPSQDDLPSHRNAIGDMWLVGSTPWVWIWAPGATHADWIDP